LLALSFDWGCKGKNFLEIRKILFEKLASDIQKNYLKSPVSERDCKGSHYFQTCKLFLQKF